MVESLAHFARYITTSTLRYEDGIALMLDARGRFTGYRRVVRSPKLSCIHQPRSIRYALSTGAI